MSAASRLIAFRIFQMRAHAGLLVARSSIEPVDPHLLAWARCVLALPVFVPSMETRS